MSFDEVYYEALSRVTHEGAPVPVYQPPVPDDPELGRPPELYIVFNEAQGRETFDRSNAPGRIDHLVQVHVFTLDPGIMRSVMSSARACLKDAGIKTMYTGPQMYDDDTKYHHLPLYSRYVEKL